MGLFTKYKIKCDYKYRLIRFYNLNLYQYGTKYINDKKIQFFNWLIFKNKKSFDLNRPVFYLKANLDCDYSYMSIQKWLDVANKYNAIVYLIIDKPIIKTKIIKNVYFYNLDFKFIKSNRSKYHKNLFKKMRLAKVWEKTTYAHLTSFYHSKKNNIKSFWNIDADDTMLLMPSEDCADTLRCAEQYANNNNVDAFSFDMHTSRTYNRYWSFGVTYIRNTIDWYNIFFKISKQNWEEKFIQLDSYINLDCFMTYLRDMNICKIFTFFVENLIFIHWGNFILSPINSSYWQYKNNEILYPLILDFFGNKEFGKVPITEKSIKIKTLDNNTSEEYAKNMFPQENLLIAYKKP